MTRRLANVRGELSLTALPYNLLRAINLVGIPALIAEVARLPGDSPTSGLVIRLYPAIRGHSNTSRCQNGWSPQAMCIPTDPSTRFTFATGPANNDTDFSHGLPGVCEHVV